MRAKVLKPFRYSTDGVTAVSLDVGDEREFADAMAPGLIKEGWIVEMLPDLEAAGPGPHESVGTGHAMESVEAEVTAAITDQPAPVAQPKRGRK